MVFGATQTSATRTRVNYVVCRFRRPRLLATVNKTPQKTCPLAKAGPWLEIITHAAETSHGGRYDCAGRRAFGTPAPRHKTNNTFSDGLCQATAKFGDNARSLLEHFISRAQHRLRFAVSLPPASDGSCQRLPRLIPPRNHGGATLRCGASAMLCFAQRGYEVHRDLQGREKERPHASD